MSKRPTLRCPLLLFPTPVLPPAAACTRVLLPPLPCCPTQHINREMLSHPEIFKGQQVLELGSGTGLVGLVAALAGAQQVCVTVAE